MRARQPLVLVAVLCLVTSCGGTASKDDSAAPAGVDARAELAYGRAPTTGAGITYQPDVVIVGGGAGMVRSVSSDSLRWTIDARAQHIDELAPGKVMFLTGRGVGRVLQVERHGDLVDVALGPVDLTDLISDGDIEVSAPLDVSKMTFQTYTEAPAAAGPPGATASPAMFVAGRGARRLAGFPTYAGKPRADDSMPPPSTGTSVELSAGGFAVEMSRKSDGTNDELGLKVGYTKGGTTVGLEFGAKLDKPRVEANLGFRGGALTRNSLIVNGLREVSVGLVSGAEKGLAGNFKGRVEVPAEITAPLPGGPVPLVVSFRFKFIVETAFSARNATLAAQAKVKVDGPIGFSDGKVLTPTVTQVVSPVDNLNGVSEGVNGILVAEQVTVVIGVGVPAAMAGPFAALTVAYGLTNGSSIGIVQCRQTSVDVVLAGGVGFTLAPATLKFLELLKATVPWEPKVDTELASLTTTVLHRLAYQPKVAVCRP
jgi:hypothetical protein